MRIFYDHQVFSLQDAGGAARYHYELIKHLQRMPDAQVEVALGLNHSVYCFRQLQSSRTQIHETRTSMRPGLPRYLVNEAITGLLAATLGRFDIYHPTLYRAMPFVRRRRVVVTNHDCAHERFPGFFRNAPLVIKNKRMLYADADAIICVSESSRRDLLSYYDVNPGKVFVVHHGFSPLGPPRNETSGQLQPSPAYILFVGFRGTYKNFDMLLRAYSESTVRHDFELMAVGGGAFSPAEITKMEDLRVSGRVKNIQGVSDDTLALIYRNASLFVYPSLHEGFGFPPIEAMSLGCPVLVSSTASLPEICGDAAQYFDPTDQCDLKRALESALSANHSRSRLKQRGYEQALKYNWDKTSSETFRIYSSVSES